MGGPGSTRWGMTLTRMTTDGVPCLNVRDLTRAGCLVPGTSVAVSWSSCAAMSLSLPAEGTMRVVLAYRVRAPQGGPYAVHQSIQLTSTPCRFGGARVWFTCPGCGSRCAILYAVGGRFRCRTCQRLAYPSTRQPRSAVHRPPDARAGQRGHGGPGPRCGEPAHDRGGVTGDALSGRATGSAPGSRRSCRAGPACAP